MSAEPRSTGDSDPTAWVASVLNAPGGQLRTDTDVSSLVRLLRASTVDPGSVIVRAGEPASRVHFIRAGSVELRRRRGRRHTVIATLGEGDVLGDVAAMLGRDHYVDAIAVDAVELLSVESGDLADLLRRDVRLANCWLSSLAERVVETHERLDELLAGHLDHRVAAVLLRRARATAGDHRADRVDVTQQQLAQLLSVQRSSINEAMRRLEVRGLVERGYGHVLIRDHAGLEQLLDS